MRNFKIALLVVIVDFLICLIAFGVQSMYPEDSREYFMAVDYSWALRMVLWSGGFYLLLTSRVAIHREHSAVISKIVLFCIGFFVLDFVKNVLAYNDIFLWKELYAVKRVLHLGVLVWGVLKIRQLNKENYITN